MKKWIVYILGVLTGIVLTFIFAFVYTYSVKHDNGITYSETPTEFTVSDRFEIFQVLEYGALAKCQEKTKSYEYFGDPIVFITNNGHNLYYDDQIIDANDRKLIQLGTYRYSSQMGERVVPIITIQ